VRHGSADRRRHGLDGHLRDQHASDADQGPQDKDLASYSLGNILLSNLGNVVHSVYVFSLPAGPVWALHGFYLVATGLLLLWYLRFNLRGGTATTGPNQSTVVA
jgi:hypothetical protein